MRTLDAYTEERLTRQSRSVCTCWRLTRTDGHVIAVTDHDRDLVFSGTSFKSAGGADGSAFERNVSLGPDNAEIIGIFSAETVNGADIVAGRYDGASIEVFLTDWEDPAARLLIRTGTIGQIEHDGESYRAEFRSLKHGLDRPSGRVFSRGCDVELGSGKCGVDLSDSTLTYSGTVQTVSVRALLVDIGDGPVSAWFDHGFVRWTSGQLSGLNMAIRSHRVADGLAALDLWQTLPVGTQVGDQCDLVAGCDKRFETCRAKFQNSINFRGFPDIPGTDSLIAYPQRQGEASPS